MKRYAAVFILLVFYAVFLAPGSDNGDEILGHLLSGRFEEVDPLVTAVFSLLGIYPIIFLLLLIPKDMNRIPAWPFALLSFGLGAFAVLPYLIIQGRKIKKRPRGPVFLHRTLRSRFFLLIPGALSVIVLVTAVNGSFAGYIEAFFSSHLVSVMTVDLLVVIWLTYDLLKYKWKADQPWLSFIPAFGPLFLLYRVHRQEKDGSS
jgi:hypothetical protein